MNIRASYFTCENIFIVNFVHCKDLYMNIHAIDKGENIFFVDFAYSKDYIKIYTLLIEVKRSLL